MRHRPLLAVAVAFIGGILLGRYLLLPWPQGAPLLFALGGSLFLSAAILTLVSFFTLRRGHARLSPYLVWWALIGAIGVLGALAYLGARLPAEMLYRQSLSWDYIQGRVASYPLRREDRTSFVLKPRGAPGYLQAFYFHEPGRVRSPLRIDYGDELRLYAEVERPERLESFDYREYLLRRGIWGVVTLWSRGQLRLISEGGSPLLRWGYHVRERAFALLDRRLPQEESGLLVGLLFGERGHLKEELEAQFRDAGVAHVLAVSGLHLGILIGLFFLILRRVGLSPGQIYLTLVPLVGFYLLVVGFRVSLLRAALLFGFLALGWLLAERRVILRRWADPYQGLSAAALAILGWNPQALFDASFQLSFSATLGIIALARPLERNLKFLRLRWLRGLLAVSLAAQLGVLPAVAWWFHRVYLLVIGANLIVIPLVTLALWGGLALLLLGPVPYLGELLGKGEGLLLEGLQRATGLIAGCPYSYLEIRAGQLWPVLLGYTAGLGALLVLLWWQARRERRGHTQTQTRIRRAP